MTTTRRQGDRTPPHFLHTARPPSKDPTKFSGKRRLGLRGTGLSPGVVRRTTGACRGGPGRSPADRVGRAACPPASAFYRCCNKTPEAPDLEQRRLLSPSSPRGRTLTSAGPRSFRAEETRTPGLQVEAAAIPRGDPRAASGAGVIASLCCPRRSHLLSFVLLIF
jgi:hypothetical protein